MISRKLNYKSAIVLLICIFFVSTTKAQYFADPILVPFGLDSLRYGNKIAFGDLDNDGDMDLMTTGINSGSRNVFYYENTGDSELAQYTSALEDPFGLDNISMPFLSVGNIDLKDLDSDGDLDLINGVRYYENIGDSIIPQFTSFTFITLIYDGISFCSNDIWNLRYEDMDNDEDYDVFIGHCANITSTYTYGAVYYSENIGSINEFLFDTLQYVLAMEPNHYYSQPSLVDIDSDGDLDLFEGGGVNTQVQYFENIGNAETFEFDNEILSPFGLNFTSPNKSLDFVDLDNDGDQDLMMGLSHGGFAYFENDQSLSISDDFNANTLSIYPNPVKDLLTIESENKVDKIEIIDMLGKISQRDLTNSNQIHFGDLAPGMYSLRILFDDETYRVKRIIKE